MDKLSKKKNTYNTEILKRLMKKYGVTRAFVTMSLRGDRISETSDSIKADYKAMEKALTETLQGL